MKARTVDITDSTIAKLRQRISDVLLGGKAEWCFACGAGAKALRELLASQPQALRDLTGEEMIAAATTRVNIDEIKGITNWCFACGAGAKYVPETGMPVAQLEEVMADVEKILGV